MTTSIPRKGPGEASDAPFARRASAAPPDASAAPPDEARASSSRQPAAEAARWREGRRDALSATTLGTTADYPIPGLLVLDRAGHVVSTSAGLRDIFDCAITPGMLAATAARLLAAQVIDPASFAALLAEPASTASPDPHDPAPHKEVTLRDGRPIDVRIETMRGQNGAAAGRIWCFRDLAALRARELNTRFAAMVMQATIENTPDAILIVDSQGEIIAFNPRYVEIARLSPGERPGGDHLSLLKGLQPQVKNPDAFFARVHDLYNHPEMTGHETIETIDGTIYDRHSAPLFTDRHEYVGRVWFFHDITQERRDAAALKANATLLGNALKLADAAHWEFDIAANQFILEDNI